MTGDMDAVPVVPGFIYIDHTFTPEQAQAILDTIPSDSHHWIDIPRKAAEAVPHYTRLMSNGSWRNETLERGFYEHPIRWDEEGRITHGVMRLMACVASGQPFRSAVCCPEDFALELQVSPPASILAPSGRPAQRS
jgi:hypothetical protein